MCKFKCRYSSYLTNLVIFRYSAHGLICFFYDYPQKVQQVLLNVTPSSVTQNPRFPATEVCKIPLNCPFDGPP